MTTCKSCKWWDSEKPEDPSCMMGFCHRYPPLSFAIDTARHPKTYKMDWCGEFREGKDGEGK